MGTLRIALQWQFNWATTCVFIENWKKIQYFLVIIVMPNPISAQILIQPLPLSGLIQQTINYDIFLFFPENRIWYFMQIASIGDNLLSCKILFPWKNKKNISKCWLLKILPTGLSINEFYHQSTLILLLTHIMLNKLRHHAHFQLSAN